MGGFGDINKQSGTCDQSGEFSGFGRPFRGGYDAEWRNSSTICRNNGGFCKYGADCHFVHTDRGESSKMMRENVGNSSLSPDKVIEFRSWKAHQSKSKN